MKRVRVIPSLLVQNAGLVKSFRFGKYKYVGDPINAVRIFNEKEVDEIILLDISATKEKRPPDLNIIKKIASEAFMPLGYGGGVTKLSEIDQLISVGVEKVIINTSAFSNSKLISEGAKLVGSQSIVVSVDVKKNFWGNYKIYVNNGSVNTNVDPLDYAIKMEQLGAGEIFLTSIDKDGTFSGYDLDLIKTVSSKVNIPVIAGGGAGSIEDFAVAIRCGASAVAAGSLFVFQRPHLAVLISYPSQGQLEEQLFTKL